MKVRRRFARIFLLVAVFLLCYGMYYCWVSFPVVTGYSAKVLCSAIFVSGRTEGDVKSQELAFTPLNLANSVVNYEDSSVTSSMFGLAKRKAIYRKGLGATIVNDLSEQEIRSQQFVQAIVPSVQPDSIPWPMGDKLQDNVPAEVDSIRLAAVVQNLFTETDTTNPNRTRALIVVYDNNIIAEKYAPGFSKNIRLTGWSMTKSITSAIVGVLVKQNGLNIDAPAPVPEWKENDDPRHQLTPRHLLQQTTGLKFEEVYSKSSHATRMLSQHGDMGAYAASLQLQHAIGSRFHYSSGNSNILSRVIRHIIGDNKYYSFPYEQLFYRIGMYSVILEPDASGTFVGSSFCFATARDWARFGLLYLNNGIFNGQQILSSDWVKQSVTPSSAAEQGEYGFQWWLNKGAAGRRENRLFPTLPEDLFFADGFEGQNVFVIPSKKLVVVRLGLTRKKQYGEVRFLEDVIAAIR